ncbi:MAG: hypothetical protein HWN67_15645 [Candidatus Helarchaeota archaeon]|nr:hypothetical protein [Candidatus Helarchaeota archaeon]
MEDPQKKVLEIFKDAEEISFKDISIDADQIGFEVRSGSGEILPQIPIRIQYINQIYSGFLLKNILNSKNKKDV